MKDGSLAYLTPVNLLVFVSVGPQRGPVHSDAGERAPGARPREKILTKQGVGIGTRSSTNWARHSARVSADRELSLPQRFFGPSVHD
jgi:hypothetical protein